MPLPLILIGGALSAVGVGKTVKARSDQKEADRINSRARSKANQAKEDAERCREKAGQAITDLGQRKIDLLNNTVMPFVDSFEKLHNIELTASTGLKELNKFKEDKLFFDEIKELGSMASSLAGGAAGGAALGAITAFGAYSATMTFGACATTGTLISTLSGAAATNATLAFLGGGALSVGGLGIAGGTAVLGGLVAGPALAVMGFVVGAKASANKDNAYSNLEEAKEFEEQMKSCKIACNGIRMRANMYERLLIKLDAILTPLQYKFNEIIRNYGVDYSSDRKSVV